MEGENFESTRFKVFGLLYGDYSAGTTAEFQDAIAEEADASTGAKGEARPILNGAITQFVSADQFGSKIRNVIRVWYDQTHYKSILVTESTTAKKVCAIGAGKLKLAEFSYGLYALKNNKELYCLKDDDKPNDLIAQWQGEKGLKELKFLFMNPRRSENLKMREQVVTRWLNHMLQSNDKDAPIVTDLRKDLCDGLVMISIAQSLTDRGKFPHNPHPKTTEEKKHNLLAAFELLKSCGIVVPAEPYEDIHKGNLGGILRALWSIIYRWCTVNNVLGYDADVRGQEASEFVFIEQLLIWMRKMTVNYHSEFYVTDFSSCLADGKAFSALLELTDNFLVSYFKMRDLDSDAERLLISMSMANKHFGVPSLLPAKSFAKLDTIDELSVILYISVMAHSLQKYRIRKLERRSVNPDALVEGKGNVPTRIFFEGLEDTDFRTFALTKGMLSNALRIMVAKKMNIDKDSFWIYRVKGGEEKIVNPGEEVLSHPEEAIVVKMVSAAMYYRQDPPSLAHVIGAEEASKALKDFTKSMSSSVRKRGSSASPSSSGSAPNSPATASRSGSGSESPIKTRKSSRAEKRKSWRASLSGLKPIK